ncbi:MAG TPA: hypothetical protein DCM26_00430 [Desulfotomaculum sp.]|jgi:peptidoglycan/LPS O-acetylase OafA/YrhL|nr:hypothetical protein [Desulfotomaculum sp.]
MKEEFDFFDRPRNKKILWIAYIGVLLALAVADFFIPKHSYFSWDGTPVFYALFGFVACVLLVVIAKNLRPLLKRREDYYD